MSKWSDEVIAQCIEGRDSGMSDQKIADMLNNLQNEYHYTNSSIWGQLKHRKPQKQVMQQETTRLTKEEIDRYLHLVAEQQPILQKAIGINRRPTIPIDESGWFGIVFWSDQHIGNIWTQTLTILKEAEIIETTPGLYCAHGGDMTDGAIPASPHSGIKSEQIVPPFMQRECAIRVAKQIANKLILVIQGCHERWTNDAADYDFMAQAAKETDTVYAGGGTKFYLECTGGAKYCGVYHHKATGYSQFNGCHPCVRRALFHEQEADIIAVAHEHITAQSIEVIGERLRYMMRTGARKNFDKFASTLGNDAKRDNLEVPVVLVHGSDQTKQGQIILGIEMAAQVLGALREKAG